MCKAPENKIRVAESVPVEAWMSPCPELEQLALNFLATFFGRHPLLLTTVFVVTVHEVHLWPFTYSLFYPDSSCTPMYTAFHYQ